MRARLDGIGKVRLVEFVIAVLEAHGEALKRLAALFGEENLIQLLEMAGDRDERPQLATIPAEIMKELLDFAKKQGPGLSLSANTYAEIEGSVRELNLPAILEFHLWTYPLYRAFIESPLELNLKIPGPGGNTGTALVDDAIAHADAWVRALPMSELVKDQAARAAQVPWLRFRTTILKRIGRRPLGPVY